MSKLTKLADKYKTDKGTLRHNYTDFYDLHLNSIRHEELKILEIGVNYGSSVRMWLDYFPNSKVYGLDLVIEDEDTKRASIKSIIDEYEDRFFYLEADQGKEGNLEFMWVWANGFDIIIEDGSHVYDHQQLCFEYFFPKMFKGGIMIIEDLHTYRKRSTKPKTLDLMRCGGLKGWNEVSKFEVFMDKTCVIKK